MQSDITRHLEDFQSKIEEAIPLHEIMSKKHTAEIDKLAAASPFLVIISSMSLNFPFYIGPKSLKFLGITAEEALRQDMSFFARLVHPDHLHIVQLAIKHFATTPEEHFVNTYQVKTNHTWRWLYGCSKAIKIHPKDKDPKILLTILYDIEVLLQSQNRVSPTEPALPNFRDYLAPLSPREVEIFKKCVKGWSLEKIGKSLKISPTTVQTHKRNLMKKLKVSKTTELLLMQQKIDLIQQNLAGN